MIPPALLSEFSLPNSLLQKMATANVAPRTFERGLLAIATIQTCRLLSIRYTVSESSGDIAARNSSKASGHSTTVISFRHQNGGSVVLRSVAHFYPRYTGTPNCSYAKPQSPHYTLPQRYVALQSKLWAHVRLLILSVHQCCARALFPPSEIAVREYSVIRVLEA